MVPLDAAWPLSKDNSRPLGKDSSQLLDKAALGHICVPRGSTYVHMFVHEAAASMVVLSLTVLACLYRPPLHVTPPHMGIYGST